MLTLVIGDAHVQAGQDLRRFAALGKLIMEYTPDTIVIMGDFLDMQALSAWDSNKRLTMEGRRYKEEITQANKALDLMLQPMTVHNEERKQQKRRTYKPSMVYLEGNHECFPPSTEVLTKSRGWVAIESIADTDLVLTLRGGWQRPTALVKNSFKGNLLSHKSRTISLRCTPNHRLVYTKDKSDRIYETPARHAPKQCNLLVAAAAKNTPSIGLSDEQLRYCAVAATASYHTGKHVIFYQSANTVNKIREIINDAGVAYRESIRDRCIKEIYEFHMLRPAWCPRNNKVLPEWVMDLDDRQFSIFLDTLVYCDGTYPTYGGSSLVFYGKKRICDSLQAACVSHGYRATLSEYRKSQWRVNITKATTCRVDHFMTKEDPYEGPVYCVVVPDETFLIRQDNKPVFVGNCRISRYVDQHPELEGQLDFAEELSLTKRGFSVVPYKSYHYIEGTGFTHIPIGGNGKPMSGMISTQVKNVLQAHAHSVVYGHCHKLAVAGEHRLGAAHYNQVLCCGCFFEHVDEYMLGAKADYWRGVILLDHYSLNRFDIETVTMSKLLSNYE